ncbi:hypothetical protein KGF54_003074 [Candida jiufengensis]|uniref:uncharacterized protein n=1 Tax=Candida jiufengensis TaxID=497108 RepID=UPI002225688F|nr:uncharacterized protein KGF54_003074 [Candida jiufengensis]KAI5953702.1 hypothetical protein KGF54_003074 [Candida jiufengensis]
MDTTSTWSPTSIPSSTTLSSIATTFAPQLTQTLSSLLNQASTETDTVNFHNLQEAYRGVQASLTIISAEQVLATATASSVKSAATDAIFYATLNLKAIEWDRNIFGYELSRPGNLVFLILNFIIIAYIAGMAIWSRYWGFNITFFCGYTLEFIGFLGRVLGFQDNSSLQYYLMSSIGLVISPAFIMAGIYFLFGQLVVIHDRRFSILPPLFYSYFFITIDVVSLLIQAAGGGISSVAANNHTSQSAGNAIMITGICAQIFAMSIFLIFWFEFLNRLFFKRMPQESTYSREENPLRKRSFWNFFKLLFNVRSVREYKQQYLEQFYNPKFASVRDHKLFPFMPLAMTIAVIVVYIRCVYRVVELIQGYSGYLMNHEIYLLVLDATMISICGLIFFPFHPVWVFGKKNLVKLASIKKNKDKENNGSDETFENSVDGSMENQGEKSTRIAL